MSLPVAGLAEAAVRHLGHDREVVVDPDRAVSQRLRGAQGALTSFVHTDAASRTARRSPSGSLLLVAEALDGDDRPEHLALHDLGVLRHAGDDDGL